MIHWPIGRQTICVGIDRFVRKYVREEYSFDEILFRENVYGTIISRILVRKSLREETRF